MDIFFPFRTPIFSIFLSSLDIVAKNFSAMVRCLLSHIFAG